jgi:26S proteasome regulatory subunit T3
MILHAFWSCAGANYYVRILSTLNRELLKPSSSVALHRHSNALVDILPPEADSSIAMLGDHEKPDVTYQDIGGCDIQKQEIREAVELPLSNPDLYAQVLSRQSQAAPLRCGALLFVI